MRIYEVNLFAFVRLLLPMALRKERLLAFADAAVTPIRALHHLFLSNRKQNLYRLQITPQVCYLERLLNDRYDEANRGIQIEDGEYKPESYLYLSVEDKDIILYLSEEELSVILYQGSETGVEGVDFVVYVPAAISYDVAEMKALINYYKLASKTYNIIQYA